MSSQTAKTYIICDVDSASIGAVLFSRAIDSKGVKTIKEEKTIRLPIHSGQRVSFEEFTEKTKRVLTTIFEELIHHTHGNLDEVYINISAPWSSSQKRLVKAEFEKEILITKDQINNIIAEEIRSPLKKNVEFSAFDGVELYERKTLDIYANGYPTLKPLGQKAKTLEIRSLGSVMSTSTKKMFSSIAEKHFHREPVLMSNVHAQYKTVRELLPHLNSVNVLDVSGEMTELLVIEDDHLRHIASFPHGTYDMVRAYAEKSSIDETHAWQDLHIYLKGDMSTKKKQLVEKTARFAFRDWLRLLYTELDRCSARGLLPGTFLVMTDDRMRSWIQESLTHSDELTLHIHSQEKLSIMTLSRDRLSQLADPGLKQLSSFSDTNLAFLCHYVLAHYISQ
jgi:hypothetical protein